MIKFGGVRMKKLFIIIGILVVVFLGMVIFKNVSGNKNVTVQEIEDIQTYISKIYMWKEITNSSLPVFDDINNADDLWIWEVVKKNSEEYEMSYDEIKEKALEVFGKDFKKDFPKEGTTEFVYERESDMYVATEVDLDLKEDTFLLNDIKKNNNGYTVEIVEYLEDYSQEDSIVVKNTQEDEIRKVSSTESETQMQEIVKNNIDRFSKKKVYLKKDENNLFVIKVEEVKK